MQEAFLKAYRRLDQFREDSRISRWLIRIVLNESLTKLRRHAPYDAFTPKTVGQSRRVHRC